VTMLTLQNKIFDTLSSIQLSSINKNSIVWQRIPLNLATFL